MKYPYNLLVNNSMVSGASVHKSAKWSMCEQGDQVELPDNLSTAVWWRTIIDLANKRARELDTTIIITRGPDGNFIFDFGWIQKKGRQEFAEPTGPPHKPMVTHPAVHRGSYYGAGEEDYMRFTSETGVVCILSQYIQDEIGNIYVRLPRTYCLGKDWRGFSIPPRRKKKKCDKCN